MKRYALSIETATHVCSVALHEAGELLGHFTYHVPLTHSRVLLDMVYAALQAAAIHMRDLALVAVGQGPGSYTGLRIGVSFAKGVCYGRGIPLVPVSTLETIAAATRGFPLPDDALRYVLLDARKGDAYGMVLDGEDVVVAPHRCRVSSSLLEEQKAVRAACDGRFVCFLGSGADVHAKALRTITATTMITGVYPQAASVGYLAWKKFAAGYSVDMDAFSPLYLGRTTFLKAL